MSKRTEKKADAEKDEPFVRPEALKFTVARRADGRPARFIAGIPSRDLEPVDVAKLSDDQLKAALATELYEAVKPSPPSDETQTPPQNGDTTKGGE